MHSWATLHVQLSPNNYRCQRFLLSIQVVAAAVLGSATTARLIILFSASLSVSLSVPAISNVPSPLSACVQIERPTDSC